MRDLARFILAVLVALYDGVVRALFARPLELSQVFANTGLPSRADSPIPPLLALKPSALASSEYDLFVYGFVGEDVFGDSVGAREVITQLAQLPAGVTQINVRINSPGGSVPDGLAIYNALARASQRKVVYVDGVAASIASLIAMVGERVLMPPTSMLMIHGASTGTVGNAKRFREVADILETWNATMAIAYATKSGSDRADIEALLNDGRDHYYSAEQAVDEGFADEILEAATTPETTTAEARDVVRRLLGSSLRDAPFATARQVVTAFLRGRVPAEISSAFEAASASPGDDMSRNLLVYAALAGMALRDPVAPDGVGGGSSPAAAPGVAPQPAPGAQPAAPAVIATAATIPAAAQAAVSERNRQVHAVLDPHREHHPEIRALYDQAMLDPAMSIDAVRARALDVLGARAQPLTPAGATPSVQAGADVRDRELVAASDWLCFRAAMESRGADGSTDRLPRSADPNNPFRGFSLLALAEHFLRLRGVNTTRMTRVEIATEAMRPRVLAAAGHTTSDFPTLLQNVLNKLLVAAYQGAPVTWPRFCRIGDLTDFRAHLRYRIGTFSDLAEKNEAGNFQQGTVKDAERESLTGKSKGRLFVITREMIVNDDLQAFADIIRGLGRVGARTVEKDVFALLALNSGNGPTMSDSNPLFHASHNNIATAAVPTMAAVDAARILMASQLDPSGNDYLDIRPAVVLCGLANGSTLRSINEAQYDPDTANKLQKPNSVRGLFRDVIDTPRIASTAPSPWYLLADPQDEPVFEVAFLDGQREPRVEEEVDFDSDGRKYKVVLEYATGAIGWRGAVKNAGV